MIITAARNRNGRSMSEKLSNEILDACANTGSAFKKKEEMHRMAEANKAFSPFQMVILKRTNNTTSNSVCCLFLIMQKRITLQQKQKKLNLAC